MCLSGVGNAAACLVTWGRSLFEAEAFEEDEEKNDYPCPLSPLCQSYGS